MIILGNLIIFLGSILMLISSYIKSAKITILVQSIQMFLMGLGNLFLGGFSATFSNFISIFRNVMCYKNKLNKIFKILFIIVQTILGLLINNLGTIGILPILASVIYTWFMGLDDEKLKKVTIFTNMLWLIHDFYIKSYVGALFNLLGIIMCIVTIYRIKNNKK